MIIAFTGAGISKESGIPTFEDLGSLREKLDREYCVRHPKEFNKIISKLKNTCDKANPNDAHLALAEYDIPVITMNIDGLHDRAGSKKIIHLHGEFPNIVLYGDPAPNYEQAYAVVDLMRPEDVLLVIGASTYTNIANSLRNIARYRGAKIVEIQDNASKKVRAVLECMKHRIEPYNKFITREYY